MAWSCVNIVSPVFNIAVSCLFSPFTFFYCCRDDNSYAKLYLTWAMFEFEKINVRPRTHCANTMHINIIESLFNFFFFFLSFLLLLLLFVLVVFSDTISPDWYLYFIRHEKYDILLHCSLAHKCRKSHLRCFRSHCWLVFPSNFPRTAYTQYSHERSETNNTRYKWEFAAEVSTRK